MKPVRLELQGFTAFRDPAVLDFEGRRLFVITGPTGAGKSSLLDAMTWALFGRVPRVGTQVAQLLAQGAQSMHVMLEFETRGRRFRIARRAGTKGPGAVRLERRDAAGAWEPLADKTSDAKEMVERLLGMDYATFTRTILLPQGAFDAFLRGEPADRREILSRLIGLDVYERARQIAGTHATEARARADTLRAQVASLDLATPERIEALRAELTEARATQASLVARYDALRALGDRWRAYEVTQRAAAEAATEAEAAAAALQSARDALAQAEQTAQRVQHQAARVEAERATLAYDPTAHQALRMQVALLDQRDAAERDLAAARTALAAAERDHAAAEAAAALAVRAAKQAERALQQAHAKVEAAGAALAEAAASAVAGRDQQAAAARAHEMEASAAREEAEGSRMRASAIDQIAARLAAEAEAEREAVAAHIEAVRDARTFARDAAAATKAHATAAKAHEAARARAEVAAQANAAAALSRGLKKGDRCPICGEPLKAAPKHAKGDLDAAEAAVAEAERLLREAAAAASTAAATNAVAAERVEARAAAVAAAAARRAAIEGEVAALGIAPADLPKQAAREAKATEQALARAQRAEQAAERAASLERAFAVALGALGSTPAGEAEPATTPAALAKAIEAAAAADRAHRDATGASERAAHEADSAQRLVALSEQAVRTARSHEQDAARRLEGLGTADGPPAALRKAFAAAEQDAARDGQLAQAAADARAACARAEQALAGARQALGAAQAADAQRSGRLKQERETEQATLRALATDWREVLGEGTPTKAALATAQREHQQAQDAAAQRVGALGQAVEQAEQQAEQAATATAEIATHEARHRLSRELHTELQSNHFVDFLLRESLELLAQDASTRLMQFSMGRYELVTEKGDFLVTDHQNGDDRRSVRTLSGGETFLASLALALSLSEHLPEISGTGGAVSLESLFLDEGFGSLDAESLDLAVQGLETLAEGNRMVGVISHVEELSERLPSRVHVEKHAHSSVIRAEAR